MGFQGCKSSKVGKAFLSKFATNFQGVPGSLRKEKWKDYPTRNLNMIDPDHLHSKWISEDEIQTKWQWDVSNRT